ncbi:hypothetical protein CXB45_03025 [Corynebacterium mastitidis]|uniref:Uncharacterized protein n=1 Tax=Corynebacterium mastitidis TaxID=161890 RepID=A0A2N0X8W2_9CORY|nr:hypothetical protein CXB45_03025 [Corynebacterium mastitidis]
MRNVLAQIANKETADTPEKVKTTPEHPEYLETEDDYDNAPEGTIVAEDAGTPALHSMAVWCYGDRTLDSAEMEGEPRRVLRWGWEA